MSSYPYQVVDVFTNQRFGGNPLAVITDARGLSSEQMQQIAHEFHFSETTFVLPPENPEHTANVRIFTPSSEVPFAGHPNVGTAYVLAQQGELFGKPIGDQLEFEELAGLVRVRLERSEDVLKSVITAPQGLSLGAVIEVEELAAALGLQPGDILTSLHAPQFASVGLAFVCIEVASREALRQAWANEAALNDLQARYNPDSHDFPTFVYYRHTPEQISARMFAPLDLVPEDPATGSASAALGALHAQLDPRADLDLTLQIDQGVDMGRPSVIGVQVEKRDGVVRAVRVSGTSVIVMRGELLL